MRLLDSGFAPSGRASRGPVAAPRNDGTQPNLNESLIFRIVAAHRRGMRNSAVAVMDAQSTPAHPAGVLARLRAMLGRVLGGSGEASLTRRLAGTIFIIRVVSAGLAYLSQILLARWIGGSDYGVYVYVWTWVLLLGSMMDFGISVSAQKLIPEYRASGDHALLRGFLSGSRWLTFIVSSVVSVLLAAIVKISSPSIEPGTVVPLYIGCLTLPAFVVANTQDGIARSHDWMRLGLMPQFVVRQSLIIGFTAGAFALGLNLGATAAMLASAAAVWIAMIGQMIVLNRRLGDHIEAGPKTYDFRGWLAVSLPILMVEGFYLLLSYTDVLLLQQFRSSEEVGVYFAVVKTLALVSFIHYAMSATTAHRFAEYHATGDSARLSAYVAHAIKWTFWPSLAATAVLLAFGKPLLWLFGPQFVAGYDIMFVAAIGLVVRSAIGPVERLLNMLGHQHVCALAYASAFVMNVVMCVALIPRFGGRGAAAATSIALVFETVLLFWIVRRRLGLHVLAFGKS
jgi:O-antigen/teichoic acid export membrane protein